MKNVRTILMALICIFAVQFSFAQITVSPWQVNEGKGHITLETRLAKHGDAAAYKYMSIPAPTDPSWTPASVDSNDEVVFNKRSTVPCYTAVDFTYFQTTVSIPANTEVNTFEVNFVRADDGARFYIFNDKYPKGVFPPGKDLVLGNMNADNKIDLKEYIQIGGENRLVVVQFDDCASGNFVNGIQVSVDGVQVKPPTGPCSEEYSSLGAKFFGRMDKGAQLFVGESTVSSNMQYRFVVPNDKEKPRIEEISGFDICPETGDTMTRVVRTVWRMPYFKKTSWGKNPMAVFNFQADCNFSYGNPYSFFWNPTDGRDDNRTLLNKCSHSELTDDGRLIIVGIDGSELWASSPAEIKPDITNLEGAWTFGYGGPNEDLTPFDSEDYLGTKKEVKRLRHENDEKKWWSVAQNTTEENVIPPGTGINYPPKAAGEMVFHPGPGFKEHAKAKFTAPSDGTYVIDAIFTLADDRGGKVKVSMFTNASSKGATEEKPVVKLLEGRTLERTEQTDDRPSIKGTKTVALKAGEWVTLDVQNAGDWTSDSTKVQFSASKK